MTSNRPLIVWLEKQTLDSAMDVDTFVAGVQRNAEPTSYVELFQLYRDGLEKERTLARAALRVLGRDVTVGASGRLQLHHLLDSQGRDILPGSGDLTYEDLVSEQFTFQLPHAGSADVNLGTVIRWLWRLLH